MVFVEPEWLWLPAELVVAESLNVCLCDGMFDTVSVFEEFQGQGFAKELFSFIEKRAKDLGFNKLSLLVDFDNHKALNLYEKIGFKKNTILEVSKHNYHHMIKII